MVEEVGTLPLVEGIPSPGEDIPPLGQDRHPDSRIVEEGMEGGRVGGDQEGGRELHRDLVALLVVGKAGVAGHMGC